MVSSQQHPAESVSLTLYALLRNGRSVKRRKQLEQ